MFALMDILMIGKKFNKTKEKKDFYCQLHMKDIPDAGYAHGKRV